MNKTGSNLSNPLQIQGSHRRQINSDLNKLEKKLYASLSCSAEWIGSTDSSFCT